MNRKDHLNSHSQWRCTMAKREIQLWPCTECGAEVDDQTLTPVAYAMASSGFACEPCAKKLEAKGRKPFDNGFGTSYLCPPGHKPPEEKLTTA